MSQDQAKLIAELEALKARNAELEKAAAQRSVITFKVSEKGCVSVYGLQRMPVTLYASQWERLFGQVDAMKGFIAKNAATLTRKA